MEEKLKILFDFLKVNRSYNKNLQIRYYSSIINPHKNITNKIVSLLYNIANTQSQPRIDYLALFYKKIYENIECLESFDRFLSLIVPNAQKNYNSLFQGMKEQSGWGDKTSALFTKSIFHLHNNEYPSELKIWNDVPSKINKNDDFYLPVDSVIISIFNQFNLEQNWNFTSINKQIKQYYSRNDIEVWDDLWFWGFITQMGTGNKRTFEWNENKYWTLQESDKNQESIIDIRIKSEQFLSLIKNNNTAIKIVRTKFSN